MACDLCDSYDGNHGQHPEPTGGKYCGHLDSCDCSIPKPPLPPRCDKDNPKDPGISCDPDAKIRELEAIVATSQAEAAAAEATLLELTTQGNELKVALEAYRGDADNRKTREEECCEFIKCKLPPVSESTKCCVEDQIEKVCDYVHALQARARYLNWAWGQVDEQVRWQQWEYDQLLKRYNSLKALATRCHAECEEARKLYDDACKTGNETLKYLYWKIAQQLADRANDCCGDYERKLCEAFEALCAASELLGNAKQKAKRLSAELDSVKKELASLEKSENLWAEIERLVSACCDCPSDSNETPTQQSDC